MITFTVLEEPNPVADGLDRAERLAFVREGFSIATAYLAPVWLLSNRLWLAFVGYAAVAGLLALAVFAFDWPAQWMTLGLTALHLIVGLEGDSLRRAALIKRGWSEVGTVSGRNRDECERRFFENWVDDMPAASRRLGTAAAAFATASGTERLASGIGGWLRGGARGT